MLEGLIIEVNSNIYKVKYGDTVYECLPKGVFKKEDIKPIVGDRVKISLSVNEQKKGMIEKVLPRINDIKRPRVANITLVVFVISSIEESKNLLNLDKQIAYCEYLNLDILIILNKIDVDIEHEYEKVQKLYKEIGYKVINTSALKGQGIDKVKEALKGNISVFSGKSGVGKSTLTNALFEYDIAKTGEISKKGNKGKHTTTTTIIYELEKDSYIIDTPGFSTFDIFEIPYKELSHYFIEFEGHIKNCRYTDCNHINQQDCGISKVVKDELINKDRYINYCKIYEELKDREEHKW